MSEELKKELEQLSEADYQAAGFNCERNVYDRAKERIIELEQQCEHAEATNMINNLGKRTTYAEVLEVLEDLEWSYDGGMCPECGQTGEHLIPCKLHEAMKRLRGEPKESLSVQRRKKHQKKND